MRNVRHRVLAAICVVTLLGGVISACAPAATPTPQPISPPASRSPEPTWPFEFPTLKIGDRFFAEEYVIVTGAANRVEEVVDRIQAYSLPETVYMVKLVRRARLDLWYVLPSCRTEHGDQDIVIDLYGILPSGQRPSLEDVPLAVLVADAINRLSGSPSVSADVVWGVLGSGDDPYGPEGSPWTDFLIPPDDESALSHSDFWTQWAFDSVSGIGLPSPQISWHTGQGVRVGVFDSRPLSKSTVLSADLERSTLTVTLGVEIPTIDWPFPVPWSEPIVPRFASHDHGLFVAGLIHAVAPGSDITLYPVLDENLQGDLFTLNAALHTFISETLAAGNAPSGAVINLSLGFPIARAKDLILGLQIYQGAADEAPDIFRGISSLKTLLSVAHCRGIAVVAAAGNHKGALWAPAEFMEVVGVGATTSAGEPACYSNEGKVAAPGGGPLPEEQCRSPFEDEKCAPDCSKYGLISLVMTNPERHQFGYAYGAGTSFSTPLVSGLAACVLEAEGGWKPPDDPDHVYRRIEAAAADGIIDMSNVLPR